MQINAKKEVCISAYFGEVNSIEERLLIDRLRGKTPQTIEVNHGLSKISPTSHRIPFQVTRIHERRTQHLSVQRSTRNFFESTRRLQIGRFFFVKAEVSPIGESNHHAYATEASGSDPGMRFGLRVSLRDDKGEDSFVGYASSSTWQAIAIANSCLYGLDDDTFEEICRRQRRFVYVDNRIKNLPP
jgi:hypothetical protein